MGRPGKKHARLGIAAAASTSLLKGFDDETPIAQESERQRLPSGFQPSEPEASYARVVPLAHRRRLGQFFTPQAIADLLCRWAAQVRPTTMLDPAAGTGILTRTFHQIANRCEISAIEVDPLAAEALCISVGITWQPRIIRDDFLTWTETDTFDAVVANPPYLRHHDISYPAQLWRHIERRSGVKLSRLTNAYVLFILEIARRLNPGGRAAIIVPGEWLNANFGRPLKEFLLRDGWLQQLIYFSHAETLFPDALTTACLLLIERPRTPVRQYRLRTLFVQSSASIAHLEQTVFDKAAAPSGVIERHFSSEEILSHPKWNSVLENGLPEFLPGFVPLGELATTCRGIATGANSFFHLSLADARAKGLSVEHLNPCIGRARDVVGYAFGQTDFARLLERNAATHLFCAEDNLSPAERRYLAEGETAQLPERYLLSQRSPWYTMERREPAPIWAAVFGRSELRFVFNDAGILNLTTFHAIYPRFQDREFAIALTACLNSPVVQERAKLQHRVYGGGLLKYEPKDLLEIQLPDLRRVRRETISRLAQCLTNLDLAAKSSRADQSSEARTCLNEAVLMAADEAVSQVSLQEPEHPFELGPLWARHTHRDDPALSLGVPRENPAAE